MPLSSLLLFSAEDWKLLIQYIFYGLIFVIGLIVLMLMRRADRRSKMTEAKEKTEKLIKRIETLQGEKGMQNYLIVGQISQIHSAVGDLLVLAEQEVIGNRNITYDGVLTIYKDVFQRLETERFLGDKNGIKDALKYAHEELVRADKFLSEIV